MRVERSKTLPPSSEQVSMQDPCAPPKSRQADSPKDSFAGQEATEASAPRRAPPHTLDLWPGRSQVLEVAPSVCITNYFAAKNGPLLREHRITHVVVCADELPCAFPSEFAYLKLAGLTDNTGTALQGHLDLALPWMRDASSAGGRVLLHCASGSSRSGAVAVAYLMWRQRLSLEDALEVVTHTRPVVLLNPGFRQQLQQLEAAGTFAAMH